ncbi:MAG: phosphoribosylglycinamide formyltransferase 2, partial [Cyanobacteria bacterium J06641_5]
AEALAVPDVEIRLFGKPTSRPNRRMGVALAKAENADRARAKATAAANCVRIIED